MKKNIFYKRAQKAALLWVIFFDRVPFVQILLHITKCIFCCSGISELQGIVEEVVIVYFEELPRY